MEQLRRRKCRVRSHKILEVEQLKRWNYKQKNHKTSMKKKNHRKLRNKDMWRLFQQ
jgi:hypothetical protein